MIRMSKLADYGLVLMTHFLRHEIRGQNLSARQMAHETGLPLPMVSKVLKVLAREGLLVSHRGVSGGYSLNRSPAKTSVAEVIRALEGPISMVQCGSDPGACDQESICPTRINWARISHEVERALERVPIAEMVSGETDASLVAIEGEESAESATS